MFKKVFLFSSILFFVGIGCKTDKKTSEEKPQTVTIPPFNKDSAYTYVKKQVEFGPRVPSTEAHKACGAWLVKEFKKYGAKVIEQDFKAQAYHGGVLEAKNIIASFNPETKTRILLAAHWDTRFMADEEKDETKQKEAILGADDGGSGVAVLLEIARQIKANPINLGVDIILFDAEDQGNNSDDASVINTWCIGAQHWSNNPHVNSYRAKYGILLDMVGAKNARFTKEEVSRTYAPTTLNKIWTLAKNLGYSNYFADVNTPGVTDDHYFVNTVAKIPMIDIINRPENRKFGHYWHTHKDNMDVIDPNTMKAVGKLVLNILYKESIQEF